MPSSASSSLVPVAYRSYEEQQPAGLPGREREQFGRSLVLRGALTGWPATRSRWPGVAHRSYEEQQRLRARAAGDRHPPAQAGPGRSPLQ